MVSLPGEMGQGHPLIEPSDRVIEMWAWGLWLLLSWEDGCWSPEYKLYKGKDWVCFISCYTFTTWKGTWHIVGTQEIVVEWSTECYLEKLKGKDATESDTTEWLNWTELSWPQRMGKSQRREILAKEWHKQRLGVRKWQRVLGTRNEPKNRDLGKGHWRPLGPQVCMLIRCLFVRKGPCALQSGLCMEFLAGKKSVTSISQTCPVFLASLLFELISAFLLQLGGA